MHGLIGGLTMPSFWAFGFLRLFVGYNMLHRMTSTPFCNWTLPKTNVIAEVSIDRSTIQLLKVMTVPFGKF